MVLGRMVIHTRTTDIFILEGPESLNLGASRSFRLSFPEAGHNSGAEIRKEARFGDAGLVVVAAVRTCLTKGM